MGQCYGGNAFFAWLLLFILIGFFVFYEIRMVAMKAALNEQINKAAYATKQREKAEKELADHKGRSRTRKRQNVSADR